MVQCHYSCRVHLTRIAIAGNRPLASAAMSYDESETSNRDSKDIHSQITHTLREYHGTNFGCFVVQNESTKVVHLDYRSCSDILIQYRLQLYSYYSCTDYRVRPYQ